MLMQNVIVMLLLQLQFLFELPARLKKCIEMGAYSQAVRCVIVPCNQSYIVFGLSVGLSVCQSVCVCQQSCPVLFPHVVDIHFPEIVSRILCTASCLPLYDCRK